MTATGRDVWAAIDRVELGLRQALGQLEALKRLVAELDLPDRVADPPECPQCGPITLPRECMLADHLRNVHGLQVTDGAA